MVRRLSVRLCLLAALVVSASVGAFQDVTPLLERAETMVQKGAYAELLEFTNVLAHDYPTVPEVYRYRGQAKRMLKDVAGALADYNKAIELDPKSTRAWRGRGLTKRALPDLGGALADLDQAIGLAPADALGYTIRADIKGDLKDFRGAIADVDRALELQPGFADNLARRGFYKDDAGDAEGAEQDFGRALEIDPKLGMAWLDRGYVRRKAGNYAGSYDDYSQAIALGYSLPGAYLGRAFAAEKLGRAAAAIEDARQCLKLSPNNRDAALLIERLAEAAAAEERKAEAGGRKPSSGKSLTPAPFGIVTTATSGLVSKDPDDPGKDPVGDVLWKPRSAAAVRMPTIPPIEIPPTMEFSNLSMSLYTWSVTTAKEGMRVVMGPMTSDDEARFEAKWAPYYDAPTPEVVAYLNDLIPLLAQFLQARSGFVLCAQETSKATYESVALAEQGKHDLADVSMEAARVYKRWMDGYEATMRLALADIEKLGPMPNPYAARRARAKRLQDEINRLPPPAQVAGASGNADYFVLVKIEKLISPPLDKSQTLDVSEGVVAASSTGRLTGEATMSLSGALSWTPLPRVVKARDNDAPPIIAMSASTTLTLNNISNERAAQLGLLDRNTGMTISSARYGTSGEVCAAADSSGKRPTGKATCNLLEALQRFGSSGPSDNLVLYVNLITQSGIGAFAHTYRRASLTSDQAAQIAAKGAADVASLTGAQQETARAGEANAAKAIGVQYLLDSRRMFEAERDRALADLKANRSIDTEKELTLRYMYADAQAQATQDAIAYAQTGQWVRTRTLYDDYDFNRMLELGRDQAVRIAQPVKSVKAMDAQIQLAPEFMRLTLREQFRTGLTSDMMRGRNPEGLRALATNIGTQVQAYWVKQSGRESFKGQLAGFAEEGTTVAAGIGIVGAGSVYVAGLGVTGAALWGADTLIGAAYGGASGYVEGGPDEAARKSLEWAGLLGFSASAAIQSYGEGASGSAALGAAARAVVFAKTMEFAGAVAGGFFARPSVRESFELARFKQELAWGQALVQRFQRAETTRTLAAIGAPSGPTLARIERELAEATAAVNGSWHAKAVLKYGPDQELGQAFIRRVENLYGEVMPDFQFNLRAMGYRADRMTFEPIRNPSSGCTVGMDLDLALTHMLDPAITRGGTRVTMSTFNVDAQQAYNRAYFARTGYTAEQSLINVTSAAHREAFTRRMIGCPVSFESLTAWDRQRAAEVLLTKVTNTPLPGFTQAAESARALEKELRLRLLPDLRTQVAAAVRSGDKAQARRLSDSVDYWAGIQSRTSIIAQGETDPYRLWGMMQELTASTGGKDVFELARTLSAYWPALAKWR